MVYCVAFGCKNKHVKGSGISFHSFPAAGPRRKQWVHYCKRADFTNPTHTSKLCSKHFSKEQFAVNPETYAQYGYENAKAISVETISYEALMLSNTLQLPTPMVNIFYLSTTEAFYMFVHYSALTTVTPEMKMV